MVDFKKQIVYWTETSKDDWRVAQQLLKSGEVLHGMFFVHLTLEKALKANICKHAESYAPRSHDLLSLAEKASISLTQEQVSLLSEINTYNIRGRYPDTISSKPALEDAKEILSEAEILYKWLIQRL